MADINYGTSFAGAETLWEAQLSVEALKETILMKFAGKGPDNIIVFRDMLSKHAGDTVKYGLRRQARGAGVLGDNEAEGSGIPFTVDYDSMIINQLRFVHAIKGRMSQQRIAWEKRAEARSSLTDIWADRFEVGGFHQLAGNDVGDARYTGLQVPVLPDAAHWAASTATPGTLATGTAAYENSTLTTSMPPSLADLASLRARAQANSNPIRSLKLTGLNLGTYCFFGHLYTIVAIQNSTATQQWYTLHQSALNGGFISKNPLFTGAEGMFRGVVIHSSLRIPWGRSDGVDGTNLNSDMTHIASNTSSIAVARNVFVGAGAMGMAFGRDNESPFAATWVEESKDGGNRLNIYAGFIFGQHKTRFGSADHAVIAYSTSSPQV